MEFQNTINGEHIQVLLSIGSSNNFLWPWLATCL